MIVLCQTSTGLSYLHKAIQVFMCALIGIVMPVMFLGSEAVQVYSTIYMQVLSALGAIWYKSRICCEPVASGSNVMAVILIRRKRAVPVPCKHLYSRLYIIIHLCLAN